MNSVPGGQPPASNVDAVTVAGFGEEWSAFDQSRLSEKELQTQFDAYFACYRWDLVNGNSVGVDVGCGSGRWARLLAPHVGHLHCIDPSEKALEVAKRNLRTLANVTFHHADASAIPIPAASMDFVISLGVLHHVPDTAVAIDSCVKLLKPGAPILLYLYYRFDNRPTWFRAIWFVSDLLRRLISRLPIGPKKAVSDLLALAVYLPVARTCKLLESLGVSVRHMPLSMYRNRSFYTMRTDALDRFGTRLEHRFTRTEITKMLVDADCDDIRFSNCEPFWCVCATRKST